MMFLLHNALFDVQIEIDILPVFRAPVTYQTLYLPGTATTTGVSNNNK